MMPAMRYLRLLTNAVAGGLVLSLYVVVLLLQLNPHLSPLSVTVGRWTGAVLAFYLPYLAVGLFLPLLGRDALSRRPLRPAWLSVRLLAWVGALSAAGAAAATWANLSAFESMLTEAAAVRMRDGAWLTSLSALAMVVIAIARYSFGRRGSRATGLLTIATMSVSVGGPVWLRGPGETPVRPPTRWTNPVPTASPARVHVIALDGASLGFIRQRIAAGQLPNLARMLDRGAVMDLATVRPTETGPAWAAAATGRLAPSTGIRSNWTYRVRDDDPEAVDILPDYCFTSALVSQGFVRAVLQSSSSLQTRTLWDILGDYRVAVGVVNWPLTAPARVRGTGYILSDRFDEGAASPFRLLDAGAGDPTTTVDIARAHFDRWQGRDWFEVLSTFSRGEVQPPEVDRARWDRAYSDAALELERQFAPRFTAVRFESLDAFGHNFLRQAQPELFGDPRWSVPIRPVLDRAYSYIDGEVGRAIRALSSAGGDTLVIVISGFGMDPNPLGKRLLARLLGEPDTTGSHEQGPDGFLLAYGANVANVELPRGSLADLAPTVLYYMGVPVSRDLDGVVRTDLFVPAYTAEHPVKYVSSHER